MDWDTPPKEGEGAWHTRIELIDPDGENFDRAFQSIPKTRKLFLKENPSFDGDRRVLGDGTRPSTIIGDRGGILRFKGRFQELCTHLCGKALVERENVGFDLTKSDLCPSFIKDLTAKGVGLRVVDSHTGNHHEDGFTPLETIRRFLGVIRSRSHLSLKERPSSQREMDFRSFMMEGVDGEFNFLPKGGLDEEGNSPSTRPNPRTGISSKTQRVPPQASKASDDASDPLDVDSDPDIHAWRSSVTSISALSKVRVSCDAIREREVAKDKACAKLERKSTERVHSDEMDLLVAKLVKAAMFYGRCTAFEEVIDLKEPFVLEKILGYHPSSGKEFDQAGDDLATASYPFITKATVDLYVIMEQLLSKKPRSLHTKPAPSYSKPSSLKAPIN
ncbi:hypothetical protein Tco_0981838 [Tanacetum coccineum]